MAQSVSGDPSGPYVGKDLGSREFICTPRMLRDYFEGLGVDPAWYENQSAFDRPVAPSMMLAEVDGWFEGAGFENYFGNLWIRQEWDLRMPIVPGTRYTVSSRIGDIYPRRDRTVVKQEVTLWSPRGDMMARGQHHQSYLLNQSSGKVQLRDPRAKSAARAFQVPSGEELSPVDRTLSLEMCGVFFHGDRHYHTDKKASEELGFDDVVVGGKMTLSLIGDMLDKRFGRGFYAAGTLDVKFTNIVWPNDHVTARGVITERAKEGGDERVQIAVWMEKDDGTVVLVGTVSALD